MPELSADDRRHLGRAVELARSALEEGDDPFGSLLVDEHGAMLAEARNREVTDADPTAHPELWLARFASAELTAETRAGATVYTSGEHCPMCAAAHGWVGLGRIVFAASGAQLATWRSGWGRPAGPVAVLPVTQVLVRVEMVGPVRPFDTQMRAIHRQQAAQLGFRAAVEELEALGAVTEGDR
jgi:tRNA(Arg) A34 adenosine deaminase TadA